MFHYIQYNHSLQCSGPATRDGSEIQDFDTTMYVVEHVFGIDGLTMRIKI